MKLFTAGTARNVATGVKPDSLSQGVQIALAICAQVGTAGAAKAANKQASAMMLDLAYGAQQDARNMGRDDDTVDVQATRDAAWKLAKGEVLDALHDAAMAEYVGNLQLHSHVKSVKIGSGKVVGIDALLARATNTALQYVSNIERAWALGLNIKADTVNGEQVPESMSALIKRSQAESEAKDVVRSAGRATAKTADEFAAAIRQALVGTETSPQIASPQICQLLDKLLPQLSYIVLTGQAGNDESVSALVDIALTIAAAVPAPAATPSTSVAMTGDADPAASLPEGPEQVEENEANAA